MPVKEKPPAPPGDHYYCRMKPGKRGNGLTQDIFLQKKNPPKGRVEQQSKLLSLGHFTGHASLLTVRGVLGDNALSSGLIDSGRGGAQHFSSRGIRGGSGIELLDSGLGSRLHHLVAESLALGDAHTLDSRLNIRQRNSPPQVYSIISTKDYTTLR